MGKSSLIIQPTTSLNSNWPGCGHTLLASSGAKGCPPGNWNPQSFRNKGMVGSRNDEATKLSDMGKE